MSNLYDLIRPLRARSLGELRHIIIIYPSDFPLAVWQRISIFESIWIIRGSALEEADIRRAGMYSTYIIHLQYVHCSPTVQYSTVHICCVLYACILFCSV